VVDLWALGATLNALSVTRAMSVSSFMQKTQRRPHLLLTVISTWAAVGARLGVWSQATAAANDVEDNRK